MVSQTRQLTAAEGYPPYSWSITTTSGAPGYLNAYTGGTVIFTATGLGECYITLRDTLGNIQVSPTIRVTATSAPLYNNIYPLDMLEIKSEYISELFEEN
ncbi:MAG: hypothetical protein N3A72_07700 [bacterium]|nr:hypothetical protein [bacterium]